MFTKLPNYQASPCRIFVGDHFDPYTVYPKGKVKMVSNILFMDGKPQTSCNISRKIIEHLIGPCQLSTGRSPTNAAQGTFFPPTFASPDLGRRNMPSLPIIKPMLVSCAACVLQAMAFGAVGGWFLDQWGIYLYNLRVCIVYHQFLHWIGDLGVHIQLYIYIYIIYISHYTPCAEQIQYANFRANVAWMGWDSNGIMMNSPISQCQGPGVGNGQILLPSLTTWRFLGGWKNLSHNLWSQWWPADSEIRFLGFKQEWWILCHWCYIMLYNVI